MGRNHEVPLGDVPVDVNVGELLRLVENKDSVAAWTHMQDAAQHVVRSARADAAHVSDIVVAAASNNWSALRRAEPETPLRGWSHGALKNLQREESRTQLRQAPDDYESLDAKKIFASTAEQGWSEVDLSKLTPEQSAAFEIRLEGKTIEDVAKAIGCSPTAVRNRLARAVSRLRGESKPPKDGRTWAAEMLRSQRFPASRMDSDTTRFLLAMHIAGATRAEIADVLGVSAEAIRKRLRRWKSWAERRKAGQ